MSRSDGLYRGWIMECQSHNHDDQFSEIPEAELYDQMFIHFHGEPITLQSAIRYFHSIGWRKVNGKWICKYCLDEEDKQ